MEELKDKLLNLGASLVGFARVEEYHFEILIAKTIVKTVEKKYDRSNRIEI